MEDARPAADAHDDLLDAHRGRLDQVQFEGAGTPRAIVLDAAALDRAARLGAHVAEQIGRAFDAVEYRGDAEGVCPLCHLDVVVLRGRDVECATCGARGTLVVDGPDIRVRFDDAGRQRSVLTMREKREHFFEIQDTAKRQAAQRDEIESRARPYDAFDRRVVPASQ
jgi:hypothetical protein